MAIVVVVVLMAIVVTWVFQTVVTWAFQTVVVVVVVVAETLEVVDGIAAF